MLKTSTYVVEAQGRDKGKHFLLTEMPVTDAENWSIDLLLCAAEKANVPPEAFQYGMAAVAQLGLMNAIFGMNPERIKPLLARLMQCVRYVPNPQKPHVTIGWPEMISQIEEVKTSLALKWEVIKLHMDFSQTAALSKFFTQAVDELAVKFNRSTPTSPE
jgi:hypothetical protein